MVEKIDTIGNIIYCYNSDFELLGSLEKTSQYDAFYNEFSDTQELLTTNVSNPIKRVMKFYNINNGLPQTTQEIDYIDMTSQQQAIVDNYINEIQSNI